MLCVGKFSMAFLEFLQLLYRAANFSRAMELHRQLVTTGAGDASALTQRGAQCLVRLTRGQLIARALDGLTFRDPSDGVACL